MGIRDPYFMACYNPKKQLGFLPRKKKAKNQGAVITATFESPTFIPPKCGPTLMTPVFLGKFPNKKLPHFCGENSPLAVPRVVDAWHFAWLNSDLRRVKRNHPEKVPASLEDPPNNNKTHGFFRQE